MRIGQRTLFASAFLLMSLVGSGKSQTSPGMETGLKPFQSYLGGQIDSVNLGNGNLTLHIPLISYPQRGKLQLAFFVRYNNKAFVAKTVLVGGQDITRWEWAGSGVDIGRVQTVASRDRTTRQLDPYGNTVATHLCYLLSDDGSTHQISSGGMTPCGSGSGRSLDASGYLRTGSTVRSDDGISWTSGNATDSNGNQVLTTASGWVDTIGRTISGTTTPTATIPLNGVIYENTYPGVPTSDFSGCPGSPAAARIWDLPVSSGATASYKLCYGDYSYSTNFGVSGINETSGTARLLQAIVLPDGTYWSFGYDSQYLDLISVQLPIGGTISYSYLNSGLWGQGSRNVVTRTVNDGTVSNTWNFVYSGVMPKTTTVTDPLNQQTVHFFDLSCGPYETKTQWYSSIGSLLKTVEMTYTCQENPYDTYSDGATFINTVRTGAKTTWPTGHVSQTSTAYDAGITYSMYDIWLETTTYFPVVLGSVLNETIYDFGANVPGGKLREVVNTYKWQSDSNYLNANQIDLLADSISKDGSGNRAAQVQFEYDTTALVSTSASPAPQHDYTNYSTANTLRRQPHPGQELAQYRRRMVDYHPQL